MSGKAFRVKKRVKDDFKVFSLAENWKEILEAKISKKPISAVRLKNGVHIKSPEDVDLAYIFHEIWIDEYYSPPGYEITDGQTIVDIGANIGVFALYAATRAPGGRVYSFEPFPKSADYFEDNVRSSRLDNIKLFRGAVAGETGERTLQVNDSWLENALSENSRYGEEQAVGGVTVKTVSLEDALADIEQCDLLKIDCEGSEFEILYSSPPETLKKVRRIVGEYHQNDKERMNVKELCRFLEQHSFQIDLHRPENERIGMICARKK